MGIVNIPINVVGGNVQQPPVGVANRLNQTVIWTISNPSGSGITFANPPIVFPSPPPAGYNSWPGSAVTSGPGANQWTANVNLELPSGQNQTYKYDIVWTTGRMDPDLENQGYPPGEDEKDKDKDKDKDRERER